MPLLIFLYIDNFHQSRDTPPSTVYSTGESENLASTSVVESDTPVTQSRAELADDQSDTDPSEDDHIPTVSSQAVLLEDPLILNSPRITIPKKYNAMLKHIKWPKSTKSCSVSRKFIIKQIYCIFDQRWDLQGLVHGVLNWVYVLLLARKV